MFTFDPTSVQCSSGTDSAMEATERLRSDGAVCHSRAYGIHSHYKPTISAGMHTNKGELRVFRRRCTS